MARFELVFGQEEWVNRWVGSRGVGEAFPQSYTAIGWAREGELVGGLVFHTANRHNCWANIALAPGVPFRRLLHAGLVYAFGQLALRRLTFSVSSSNLPSIKFVKALGADHEATLREAGSDREDILLFALFPESCPQWSRINEQRRRGASSPGSSSC